MDAKYFDLVLHTEINRIYYKIKWTIGNADKIPEIIKTPKFSFVPGSKPDWYFTVEYTEDVSISVLLNHDSEEEQPLRVECTTCAIDGDEKRMSETVGHVFHSIGSCVIYKQVSPINSTLHLEFNFLLYGLAVETEVLYCAVERDNKAKKKRFGYRMSRREPPDVRICVRNEDFKAYRRFLRFRIPEFVRTHLKYGNQACLHDVDPEIFKSVFNYIYTNKISRPELSQHPKELYKLACMFGMRGLERICAEELKEGLDFDNAVEYFQMAESYRELTLLEAAQKFIRENFEAVRCRTGWKTLEASRPNLKSELRISTGKQSEI